MVKILVYTAYEDSPDACTAEKMLRHGVAERVYSFKEIPTCSVVLNPFAASYLKRADRYYAEQCGLVAIDVSWKRGVKTLKRLRRGQQRVLPILLAANNVNYGKPFRLSTAEAVIAALIIMGFDEEANKIASLFKWGSTFIQLNSIPLKLYSEAKTDEDVERIQRELFFPELREDIKILTELHKLLENDDKS